MNKKGFTLIELLAVIVILAIIMVIAVPQILNAIENSRKSAAISSAQLYVRAIEYNNKFSDMKPTEYTKITSGDVSGINVNIKGEGPTSGSVTINENGKVSSASLCIQGYTVNYNGTSATVGSKCGSSTPAASPVAFSTDSWSTIALNQTSNVYKVGDEKELQMDVDGDNTLETYHIQIVNKSACTTETSETACGMVLQFKELLNITDDNNKQMNSSKTNAGGWRDCKMRTYLNSIIYSRIPSELRSLIKTTKVISGHEKDVTDNYVTNDKLYLLSTVELGLDVSYDTLKDETRKLDYYPSGSANDIRRKYLYNTETLSYWWTRSTHNNRTDIFSYVSNQGGNLSYFANSAYGVSPAFRLMGN